MRVISLKNTAEMKDRELIEKMDALEDLINWLEDKNDLDMPVAAKRIEVDQEEVEQWLNDPKLDKVRQWLEEK